MVVFKNIRLVDVVGPCLELHDTQGKITKLCYPDISDAVLRGKTEITEFHRGTTRGLEISTYFDTPITCEIRDHTLRCPFGELASWER